MDSWQKVYSDEQRYRAEIVSAVLQDNDINSVILSKKDSAYHLGQFEVLVSPDQVLNAIKIVKEEINFE